MESTSQPHPPGPKTPPLLGSALDLIRDAVAFSTRMARDFGPISRTNVGPRNIWFLSDSELIEAVLVGKHRVMHKDEVTRRLEEMVGQGLMTSEG